MDLAAPEMRALIDLRFKPQFRLHTPAVPEPIAIAREESAPETAAQTPIQPTDGELRRTAH
jgi:hypothetical protein